MGQTRQSVESRLRITRGLGNRSQMREFEEAWTKVRIVLEFGHVQIDVGGGDASFESGKDQPGM